MFRAIGPFVLAVSLAGHAQAGGVVCTVVDSIWRSGHSSAQTTIRTAVDEMAATFASESQETHRQLISAISVATRQRSVSGEREVNATRQHAEAAANVYVEQRAAEEIRRAHATYGTQGQMVGGCDMIADLAAASQSLRGRNDRTGTILSSGSIDAAPGMAVTPLQAAARRLAFDTDAAVSAATFFDSATSSSDRDAFMNNVIGLPYVRPDGINQVEDELLFMQARRWEAIRSPAIVSLASLRAAIERGDTSSDGYIAALDFYIRQFGGGPAYDQWSAALVTKSEVGLMKEIARLRAISLELSGHRQSSQDRQLAVIATLLAGMSVR